MKFIVFSTENKTRKRTKNVSVFWVSIFFTIEAVPFPSVVCSSQVVDAENQISSNCLYIIHLKEAKSIASLILSSDLLAPALRISLPLLGAFEALSLRK